MLLTRTDAGKYLILSNYQEVLLAHSMSSTIYYRFRSQKDNSRIAFDGTGLTVFDLKKEIIYANKLEPATDFNLGLYNPDTNEEYADDNQVIARSSSVIARRYPANKFNKLNASRYIVGKPRVTRVTTTAMGSSAAGNMISIGDNKNVSEDDRIKAMFQNQDMAWQETQEHMDNATPVFRNNGAGGEAPPPGYMCYRCGGKDHFIKNCPTNMDQLYDGKRIKRTAGIPKSSLKTVDKVPDDADAGSYMLDDEGKFVVAMMDTKAWETFQKKQNLVNGLNKDSIKDKTLIDPINNRLLNKPVKTPCCSKTYSMSTIENSLIENDFTCPNCEKKDIFLDQLKPDEEAAKKVKAYLEEEAEKNGLKRSDIDDIESNDLKRFKGNDELPHRPILPIPPNGMMPPGFMPGMVPPPPFMMVPPPGQFQFGMGGDSKLK